LWVLGLGKRDSLRSPRFPLTVAVDREARKRPEAKRLMTHPGVGSLTALAYVLIIGTPTRFQRGKHIGTYVGMIPCEDSSARKQRLGHMSKQGNSLLRFLLVEAAQAAARIHPDWKRRYIHLATRRSKKHRQGSDGTAAGGSVVLDVAEWL
jgi:transposase